eukprot:1158495-Pelagomonas_calceolata.AAC.15
MQHRLTHQLWPIGGKDAFGRKNDKARKCSSAKHKRYSLSLRTDGTQIERPVQARASYFMRMP